MMVEVLAVQEFPMLLVQLAKNGVHGGGLGVFFEEFMEGIPGFP